jgi:hypothetical protein
MSIKIKKFIKFGINRMKLNGDKFLSIRIKKEWI